MTATHHPGPPRLTTLLASAAVLCALAGCGGSPPHASAPAVQATSAPVSTRRPLFTQPTPSFADQLREDARRKREQDERDDALRREFDAKQKEADRRAEQRRDCERRGDPYRLCP